MLYDDSMSLALGIIAGFLAMIQVVPYVISILRGETKPSRASYAIWGVIEITGVVGYLSSGATDTKWVPLVLAFNAVLVFCLALRYGVGGFVKLDLVCLFLAFIAIVGWLVIGNPSFTVYVAAGTIGLGYIPTWKKIARQPETENTLSWVLYALAALCNVCALSTLDLVLIVPPVAYLCFALITVWFLVRPNSHPTSSNANDSKSNHSTKI